MGLVSLCRSVWWVLFGNMHKFLSVLKFLKSNEKILAIFSMEKLLDNKEPERALLRVQQVLLATACWIWWVISHWLSYSPGKSRSTAKAAAKVRQSSAMSKEQYGPVTLSVICHGPAIAPVKPLLEGRFNSLWLLGKQTPRKLTW